jgi:hypothetical protein
MSSLLFPLVGAVCFEPLRDIVCASLAKFNCILKGKEN